MNHKQRFALFYLRAYFLYFCDTYIRVYFARLGFCQDLHGAGNHARVYVVDIPALGRRQLADMLWHRILGGVFEPRRASALGFYHLHKFFKGRTVFYDALHRLFCRQCRASNPSEPQNFHSELQYEFLNVVAAAAAEEVESFENFQPHSYGVAKRLVHVGDEGDTSVLHYAGNAGNSAGELASLFDIAQV